MKRNRQSAAGEPGISWRIYLVVAFATILFGAVIAFIALLPGADRYSSSSVWTIISAVSASAATAVALLFLFPLINRVRYRDVRVALTGAPRAGKTVFSVALFEALMTGGGAMFTAESRTVLSVYQAIRGIAAGIWPESTPREVVRRYEGRLRFGSSRSVVDLELGDSAGEYWADFADVGSRDADYLSYVISSDGIAHVIAANNLADPNYLLGDDERDLRLAARLGKSAHSASRGQALLLVISKIDLLDITAEEEHYLRFRVMPIVGGEASAVLQSLFPPSVALTLRELGDRLSSDFRSVHITFSSLSAKSELPPVQDEEISRWIRQVALSRASDKRREALSWS